MPKEFKDGVSPQEHKENGGQREIGPKLQSLIEELDKIDIEMSRYIPVPNFLKELRRELASATLTVEDLDRIIKTKITEIIRVCDSVCLEVRKRLGQRAAEALFKLEVSLLQKSELSSIFPLVGAPYDPERHEVLAYERGQPGSIIGTQERGFTYQGKVINKALVIVGR